MHMAKFGFHIYGEHEGLFYDAGSYFNILIEGKVRRVDHYETKLVRADGICTSRFIAVIEMDGKGNVAVNRFRGSQELLDHRGVRVLTHHARELDDDRGAGASRPAEQSMKLLEIADIESAEGVSTVGEL